MAKTIISVSCWGELALVMFSGSAKTSIAMIAVPITWHEPES